MISRRPPRGRSFLGDILSEVSNVVQAEAGLAWPAERWFADPVGFAVTILGVEPWSRQIEVLEAIRDSRQVAVRGGRKIGKDFVLSIAALWWFASVPDGRVFSTATTANQVDGILYRQIRQLFNGSGKCVRCKSDKPREPAPCEHSTKLVANVGIKAHTGIVSPDLREIRGFTTRATSDKGAVSMQGFSGRMLVIEDEASAIDDEIHEALQGNLAGEGCRHVLIANPTRARGHFFDAFHAKQDAWKGIHISSLESPNIVQGREIIPSGASREWLEARRIDWVEGSPTWQIQVLGEFVLSEQGSIFPVHAIAESAARWADAVAEGRLNIGVDPAGDGGKGDESGFATRKGKKILSLHARRGMTPEAHVAEVLGLVAKYQGDSYEPARVVIDSEGETGNKAYGAFVAYLAAHPTEEPFTLTRLLVSNRAKRKPDIYDRVRDELYASLADWMRDGGAIPDDPKLLAELNEFRWVDHISGRSKATDKDDIKKVLHRSTDRADAVALVCWLESGEAATAGPPPPPPEPPDAYKGDSESPFDPYQGFGFKAPR